MKRPRFWLLSIVVLLMIAIWSKGVTHESKATKVQLERPQLEQLKSVVVETPVSDQPNLQHEEVSETRYASLTHGINISHWFAYAPLTPENFLTRVTAKDIRQIKNMGFRHIRLPLEPDVLFDEDKPESLNLENLYYLDNAIDQILSQDLAVIVDLHPRAKFMRRLFQDAAFVNSVAKFWQSLAQHLSKYSPELLFFEVLNEPDTKKPQQWNTIQPQLLRAMRSGAPKHTLIAAANLRVGNVWDSIGGLEALTPIEDPNVVYNFHFYEPTIFTFQGATWWRKIAQSFRNVPYPSSPKAITPILSTVSNETVRKELQYYGKQKWNAKKLQERISRAATWARKHKVRLTCNEFGVYRKVAPPDDRNAWIRDVRSLLEKYQIGWAMWDYRGGFSVIDKDRGERTPDVGTLRALFDDRTS